MRTMGPADAVRLEDADRDDEGATLLDWHVSDLDDAILINSYYMSNEVVKDWRTLSGPTFATPGGPLPVVLEAYRV